jgi:hypothetical protein
MNKIKIPIKEELGKVTEYDYLIIESEEDWEDMWGGKWMDTPRK